MKLVHVKAIIQYSCEGRYVVKARAMAYAGPIGNLPSHIVSLLFFSKMSARYERMVSTSLPYHFFSFGPLFLFSQSVRLKFIIHNSTIVLSGYRWDQKYHRLGR
jgi:hypothetical protein